MKKIIMLFFVVAASLALFGCNSSEFKVDGEFLAYEPQVHSNGTQMVTMVTVTIKDGKIVKYVIDARQGAKVLNEETSKYSFSWNAKTKKELAYGYRMHGQRALSETEYIKYLRDNDLNEWHEQAALIEKQWLDKGVDSIVPGSKGEIDNVAGVTITDGGYVKLAKEAVENAKLGKFQAVYCSGTDLYIAELVVAKGKIKSLVLDTLQSNANTATGSFEWKPKTKQELGNDYGMKNTGPGFKFENGAWVSTGGKSTHEWFEQANMITDWIVSNGYNSALKSVGGRGVSLNGTSLVDGTSSVTVSTDSYFTVLKTVFDFSGSSVKK